VSTTALCVRIKRRDGSILRTTSHDSDVAVTASGYEGTYRSVAALSASDMQFRATLAVDGLDLEGVLSEATGIPEREVAAGVYDMARVTVFETDWNDPSTVTPWVYGTLGNKSRTEEGGLRMEVRTMAQLLNQHQGDVNSLRCRAELGSGESAPLLRRCGKDLTAFTFDDNVTTVLSARTVFIAVGLAQDAGYFSKGIIEFLDGDNAGAVREIRLHEAGGIIHLYDPLPFDVEVGDSIRVQAGCDKTFATCRDKFDNAVNFRGEPNIPGPTYMSKNSTRQGSSKPGSSSLLGSIGRLAATAIGAIFGPVGVFIGSLVGAALFRESGGSSEGPRADDLRVTSSTAGKRVPYIAGLFPVDGNVIDARELIEEKRTKRVGKSLFSSGTKVTEYFYFFTGAISLCEGPITGVVRIWAWDKLIYDARDVATREAEVQLRAEDLTVDETERFAVGTLVQRTLAAQTEENESIEQYMTVYLGTADQEPDPTLVEIYGEGNVSAYRGQAYVVFNRLPLEKFERGAQVPQMRFEVCRPLPAVPAAGADDENTGDDVLGAS